MNIYYAEIQNSYSQSSQLPLLNNQVFGGRDRIKPQSS